ncbi:MAG: hypothetical protein EKK46_08880 [Rhodocyclaceae bacterium]|nr:MAG: hypothetical protein EKK46_08880 [Rhodocyclaceae bacterium]
MIEALLALWGVLLGWVGEFDLRLGVCFFLLATVLAHWISPDQGLWAYLPFGLWLLLPMWCTQIGKRLWRRRGERRAGPPVKESES